MPKVGPFLKLGGILGIQDQDGNLYPAYREMTQADIDQADEGLRSYGGR
ncbi:hypothetical protein [Lentilactobacillus hilgardii]|nr:hypothetical protein [Lentilactobacillus hilgardii]